ncbi:hypothetical protein HZ993_09640 [Rhodoferax sp. AJA081-3]|uniref:hypothetical protein n=1 Tax=Rhodoferax sp. AJA081-3 TaxID=2752316 RepID=UPI001ADF301C|nr:hypothetical protein [Rhodoferax sp. AJA081-3]QTN30034.1 hypothetical protein HZ993_09640 [Rhodoferax sp. AJA081-3]
MNASDRLQKARELTLEGHFAEALAEFEWIHENALSEEPALRGVRRSFALSFWVELGEQYPAALKALTAVRDRGQAALLDGTRDIGLFADVVAIDRYLGDQQATYRLFRVLHESEPLFAADCFDRAFASVVAAQDFHLARGCIPDPGAALSALLKDFNESVSRGLQRSDKRRRAHSLQAYISNFSSDVQLLLNVVRNTDGVLQAGELARASIVGISQLTVRKRVARKIDSYV